jgi:hypothetical protein
MTDVSVCQTAGFQAVWSFLRPSRNLVLIRNGHKRDIRHKKFMIHAVDMLLIFT